YFGKRYLNPLLGRWVSADPLAVHAPGSADLNVYAYVHGQILKNIDPLGLQSQAPSKEMSDDVTVQDMEAYDANNTYLSDLTGAVGSDQWVAGFAEQAEGISPLQGPISGEQDQRNAIEMAFNARLVRYEDWDPKPSTPINPSMPVKGVLVHHMDSANVAPSVDPVKHAKDLSI